MKRGRPKKVRRQAHGSAWHWKQTNCWYYTLAGTKKRVALLDEDGERIRGQENKKAAQLALSRIKLAGDFRYAAEQPVAKADWIVARVCSEYILYCERGVENGTISEGHRDNSTWVLNDFCKYCGALSLRELKKGHVRSWIESHVKWRSPATHRAVISVVQAAFNYVEENHEIGNPLKGLKRPTSQPRLHSISTEDEKAIYKAADEDFGDFLFAAIHTGLRPYCELAKVVAEDVEDTPRGMMWRVVSSKNKRLRKIPVRPEVAKLARKLIQAAPRGSSLPLFRNRQGKPWKKVTGVSRFIKLRKALSWNSDPARKRYSSYSCRHTFAHRMLSGYWNGGAGCSIEVLAELMGDTPKVAFDHYGREWGQHFQDPLWAAVGAGSSHAERAKPAATPKSKPPKAAARRLRQAAKT